MMEKKFLTYDQQIENLQKEKQLTISDVPAAIHMLEHISYYSLIGGYKDLFKHKPSGKYLHGVTFEEIVAFYYFDEGLRNLFLKYILQVERHLKSLISYLIKRVLKQCPHITRTQLLKEMGLPENWEKINRYKLFT